MSTQHHLAWIANHVRELTAELQRLRAENAELRKLLPWKVDEPQREADIARFVGPGLSLDDYEP